MVDRTNRLSKNLTTLFGNAGHRECRVCTNPLPTRRRKYCCDRCQRLAYALLRYFEWERVRDYVLRRDAFACVNPECDATNDTATLHVDHVKSLADGGPAHDPANLQTLCDECNTQKGTENIDYRPDASCPACSHTFRAHDHRDHPMTARGDVPF